MTKHGDTIQLYLMTIYKDDPRFDEIAEKIHEDYHNGDCEFLTGMERTRDLPADRYLVRDYGTKIVIVVPTKAEVPNFMQ